MPHPPHTGRTLPAAASFFVRPTKKRALLFSPSARAPRRRNRNPPQNTYFPFSHALSAPPCGKKIPRTARCPPLRYRNCAARTHPLFTCPVRPHGRKKARSLPRAFPTHKPAAPEAATRAPAVSFSAALTLAHKKTCVIPCGASSFFTFCQTHGVFFFPISNAAPGVKRAPPFAPATDARVFLPSRIYWFPRVRKGLLRHKSTRSKRAAPTRQAAVSSAG